MKAYDGPRIVGFYLLLSLYDSKNKYLLFNENENLDNQFGQLKLVSLTVNILAESTSTIQLQLQLQHKKKIYILDHFGAQKSKTFNHGEDIHYEMWEFSILDNLWFWNSKFSCIKVNLKQKKFS